MVRVWWLLCLVACGQREPDKQRPAPTDTAVVDAEGNLVIPATRTRDGYQLRLGAGRLELSLESNTLRAPDAVLGTRALERLATWLGRPIPPQSYSQPLQPLAFAMDGDKKIFTLGAEHAEMAIRERDGFIVFGLTDSQYPPALIEIFTTAFRDGPPPPRTQSMDPNLETAEPRFARGRSLDGIRHPACLGDGWIAVEANTTSSVVVSAAWGDTPKPICTLPGAVTSVTTSPTSPIAVAMLTADQTATLWTISRTKCSAVPAGIAIGSFTSVIPSPNGADVALTDGEDLVTIPTANGTPTRTPTQWTGMIYAWDASGIQLHSFHDVRTRVTPGSNPVPIARHTAISPDGLYEVTILAESLEVRERSTASPRTFTPAVHADARAITRLDEERPAWIGPHSLILRGGRDVILDVATLATRPLIDPPASVVCASSDGQHALIASGDALYESAP